MSRSQQYTLRYTATLYYANKRVEIKQQKATSGGFRKWLQAKLFNVVRLHLRQFELPEGFRADEGGKLVSLDNCTDRIGESLAVLALELGLHACHELATEVASYFLLQYQQLSADSTGTPGMAFPACIYYSVNDFMQA